MTCNTQKQKIGKANYESNLSINQEINTTMNEYHSIFKEKLMQLLDNFFLINIKEKLDKRQCLIQKMRENILKYEENLTDKIKPFYKISNNSLDLIKKLFENFSSFKTFSDRIKNEIIFQNVFDLIDQIQEILSFYMKVFHNFNAETQKQFYEQISFLFSDLEMHINLISVENYF
jgi:hypothetical protein